MYLERVEKRKDVIWGKGRIEYNGETTTGLGLFEIISMDRERERGRETCQSSSFLFRWTCRPIE